MEVTLTNARRILGSMLIPIKTATRQIRNFRGIKQHVKCNAYLPAPRKHPVKKRKGNYRRICQSSAPLGSVCIHPKSCPESQQFMDEFRLNGGYYAPMKSPYIAKITVAPFVQNWRWYTRTDESKAPCINVGPVKYSDQYMAKITVAPLVHNWSWYAKTEESKPPSSKGGPVKESGGGVGKLDAANEKGFFHKVNKSKLEQIKEMLRSKSMLRGTDNTGKKE